MARKKKHDNQEEKDILPDPASPNAEANQTPETEILESAEKSQENIIFVEPAAPIVLPDIEFSNTEELEKDEVSISPDEIEEIVRGDNSIDFSNPAYEEINTILSQWNFKHGTKFELKGNVLHDNGSSLLIDELKKDLKDWYYNLVITDLKDGTHELIFA